MAKKFNKEEICAYLARSEIPFKPTFEIRKSIDTKGDVRIISKHPSVGLDVARSWSYQKNALDIIKHTDSIIDPPEKYCRLFGVKLNLCIAGINKLTPTDWELIYEIYGARYSDDTEIPNDEEKFKKLLEKFNSHKDKPKWNLVRILVENDEGTYSKLICRYNELFNGGLENLIASGEVILLSGIFVNEYKLPPRGNIHLANNDGHERLICKYNGPIDYIGRDLASLMGELNPGENILSLFSTYYNPANKIILDALYRGELKLHQRSGETIDYKENNLKDSWLYWHEIRAILVNKGLYWAPKVAPWLYEKPELEQENSNIAVEKYSLLQLKARWQHFHCSLENILDFANEGHFGIYVKPLRDRASYWDVEDAINNKKSRGKSGKFLKYSEKLKCFIETYPYLIEEKKDFERLATDAEVELKGICQTGSIGTFRTKEKLEFYDYHNSFGFVESNLGECSLLSLDAGNYKKNFHELPIECSSAYIFFSDGFFYVNRIRGAFSKINVPDDKLTALREKLSPQSIEKQLSAKDLFAIKLATGHAHMGIVTKNYRLYIDSSPYRPFPKSYKGYFSEEDLCFFHDQIKRFEETLEFTQIIAELASQYPQNMTQVLRENTTYPASNNTSIANRITNPIKIASGLNSLVAVENKPGADHNNFIEPTAENVSNSTLLKKFIRNKWPTGRLKAKEIWLHLERLVDDSDSAHHIVLDVTGTWGEENATILWKSECGAKIKVQKGRFNNLISEIHKERGLSRPCIKKPH